MELGLLYNSNSVTEKTIAEYLQHEYGKLGIKVSLRGEEEQSYRDNMKNGLFDMIFNICWGMPYDPQSSMAAMRQRVYGDHAAQLRREDDDADLQHQEHHLLHAREVEVRIRRNHVLHRSGPQAGAFHFCPDPSA